MTSAAIPSFCERGFTNPIVMNFFEGTPDCEKHMIDSTQGFFLESILHAKTNPFSTPYKTSWTHWAMEPVSMIAKIISQFAISLILGTLGTIWHGISALNHWARSDSTKATEYAKPFVIDLTFAVFAILFLLSSMNLKHSLEINFHNLNNASIVSRIITSAISVSLYIMTTCGFYFMPIVTALLVHDPPVQDFLVIWDGTNLSHSFFYELGFCGPDGDKLNSKKEEIDEFITRRTPAPYSNDKTWSYRFQYACREVLETLTQHLELELVEKIREANGWLTKIGSSQQIKYSYPFDGNIVAKQVETILRKQQSGVSLNVADFATDDRSMNEILNVAKMMRTYQKKISFLRSHIKSTTHSMRVDPFFHKLFFTRKGYIECSCPQQDSYIPRNYYKRLFHIPYEKHGPKTQPTNINGILKTQFDFDPLDSNSQSVQDSQKTLEKINEKFIARIRINKWKADHKEPTDALHLFLNLNEKFTYFEYKAAYRRLLMRLHYSKVLDKNEAQKLIQTLAQINHILAPK